MADAPIDDDIRHDDAEYSPAVEPRLAHAWLNLLTESEKTFERYNNHCDNIDKQFASLERLADQVRDKQFQLFWANCEVIRPAIYSQAPVPVVVPKFKDRRPVYTAASEFLERCSVVAFDLAYINEIMLQVRDDTALISRGVAWCRYESGKGDGYYSREKVCIDFKHRRDFLHSISRCWYEVTWVAAASYLTRSEARERFHKHSGDAYQEADYKVDRDAKEVGGADSRERAKFWEIWHKTERRVVWVAEGVEVILDEDDPHLELQGFFPCPKPAYGTLQRGSLVPVPDVMQYRDQLEEVNLLTARIHAMSDAIELKGFYPGGSNEVADAVEAAVKLKTPGRVLVPISNWQSFGGSKEIIVWMPIDMAAQCITTLIEQRKQIIDDVYQIMGLSDIMRGATDARETLGAQQLKSQYGSTRIRDKQYELVRIARDLVCIVCDIMCEKFDPVTLIEMSQTQLPTRAMQQQQAGQLQQQMMQVQQHVMMAAQQRQQQPQQPPQPGAPDPEQAAMQQMQQQMQQQIQQLQQQLQQVMQAPTIEQVLKFLKDQRSRAFILDIETDSTVMPDENAEKKRRTEFVQELGALIPQLMQLVAAAPHAIDFAGDVLKFSTAPFRAGRQLEGSIDTFVEESKAQISAGGGQKPDPSVATNQTALQIEQLKQQTEKQKNDAMNALKAAELQMKDRHEQMRLQSVQQIEMMKIQQKQQDDAAKAQQTNQKAMAEREAHAMDMRGKEMDMAANTQKAAMAQAAAQAKQSDMAARANERRAAAAMKPPPGGGFGA